MRRYLDDENGADFQSRGKEEGPMWAVNLKTLWVGIGMAVGSFAFCSGSLLVMSARSRLQLVLGMCWRRLGFVLVFAMMGAADHFFGPSGCLLVPIIGFLVVILTVAFLVCFRVVTPDRLGRAPPQRRDQILDEGGRWTPLEYVQAFSQGELWMSELVVRLGRHLAEEEVAGFLASLSPEVRQQLQRYLQDCPHTEEAWSRNWRHRIRMWAHCLDRRFHFVPGPQVEAEQALEVRSLCRGVEVLQDGISPFPPGAAVLDPSQLAWNDEIIPKLAQGIRDEQAFEQLPILADALEDVGCADEQILGHLRGPGPHHLGCWCLTLIFDQAVGSNVREPGEMVP